MNLVRTDSSTEMDQYYLGIDKLSSYELKLNVSKNMLTAGTVLLQLIIQKYCQILWMINVLLDYIAETTH